MNSFVVYVIDDDYDTRDWMDDFTDEGDAERYAEKLRTEIEEEEGPGTSLRVEVHPLGE